ncbi:MAG: hypothetical protein OEV94_10445 [Deltaproteobacteria bacterium]|nr:hypothetical protein [Deltaproteobacteria bacterium]
MSDLRTSMLVMGPENRAQTWDTKQRLFLVDQLSILAGQLWRVGISNIFIDGSFVEEKDHPNDIDGYFVCDFDQLISGNLERHLNQLDPYKVWTWDPHSRKPYRGYPKKQLPMWHRYRVELYPHYGQSSGIRDKWGKELEFPSAFRQSRRDGTQKGILQIIRDSGDLP